MDIAALTCIDAPAIPACRFCMGSNKVLQVALGRDETDEYKQNISELSNRIRGKIGLFFTKLSHAEASQDSIFTTFLPSWDLPMLLTSSSGDAAACKCTLSQAWT